MNESRTPRGGYRPVAPFPRSNAHRAAVGAYGTPRITSDDPFPVLSHDWTWPDEVPGVDLTAFDGPKKEGDR